MISAKALCKYSEEASQPPHYIHLIIGFDAQWRDKISDYEWIFQHIAKVENVDLMRQYWCGR